MVGLLSGWLAPHSPGVDDVTLVPCWEVSLCGDKGPLVLPVVVLEPDAGDGGGHRNCPKSKRIVDILVPVLVGKVL